MPNTANNAPLPVVYVDLTVDRLDHTDSIMTMGALCARALRENGQITLYVTLDHRVEIARPYEVELDLTPEKEALAALMRAGYTGEELVRYLQGRDARKKRRELLDQNNTQKEGT